MDTSQTDAELICGETFRCLKAMEDILVKVDRSLNHILEDRPMVDDLSSVEAVYCQKCCRVLSDFLCQMLYEMTNPSSLLKISLSAVSSYHLPTYEVPKELQLQLLEAKEKTSTLNAKTKYLKREVRKLFIKVKVLSHISIVF